jgi:DNA-directed RNA polymerase subunit RPC12/RpoP
MLFLWVLVIPALVFVLIGVDVIRSRYFTHYVCSRCGRERLGKDIKSSSTTNWSGSSYRVTCKEHEECTRIWLEKDYKP